MLLYVFGINLFKKNCILPRNNLKITLATFYLISSEKVNLRPGQSNKMKKIFVYFYNVEAKQQLIVSVRKLFHSVGKYVQWAPLNVNTLGQADLISIFHMIT
jgi:hypothetical protein